MATADFRRFRVEPVGPHAWAAIGNRASGVASNAGIVDLGNVTLVIDSFPTLQAAEELWTASRLLTGRDPTTLINTHSHADHWLGNSKFRDCEIYGTVATQRSILENGGAMIQILQGQPARERIADLDRRFEAEARALFKEEIAMELAALRDLYEMYRSLELRSPNQTWADQFRVQAQRPAWFVELSGHTESDAVVFLPESKVLFAGDLVTSGTHPNLSSGRIGPWIQSLQRLQKLAPLRIVPGHGEPGGIQTCAEVEDYLRDLSSAGHPERAAPMPERYREWLSPSAYQQNLARAGGPDVATSDVGH